jgi:hypothetical protein
MSNQRACCIVLVSGVLGATCTVDEAPLVTSEVISSVSHADNCISPTDAPPLTPPAIPDDGVDDRAAFQWAIDTAELTAPGLPKKHVCIPAGTFDITWNAATSGKSLILSNKDNLTIAGSGHRSIVRFSGAGAGPNADWWLFYVHDGSENVTFRDFAIDGNESQLTMVGEQTHALEIGGCAASAGTVTRVTIQNMDFRNVRGDAVRLCGADGGGEVRDVDISHNRFINNHRSGVGLQRGTERVSITHNLFSSTQDQDIDGEPTSLSGGPKSYIISHNIIIRDEACLAIALSGKFNNNNSAMDRTIVSDNLIFNGQVFLYNVQKTTLANNVIVSPASSSCTAATLTLEKGIEDVVLSNNLLVRPSGAAASRVLEVIHNGTGNPSKVTLNGGTFVQHTDSTIAQFQNTSNLLVTGTRLEFYASSTADKHGINVRATTADVSGITVSHSEFNGSAGGGSLKSAVALGKDNDVSQVTITGNHGEGLDLGVKVSTDGSGVYTDPPIIMGNSWITTNGDFSTGSAAQPIVVGGNGQRPWLMAGAAPSGSCTTGSLFTNANGGTSTTFYVCQGGSWVAK